MKQVCKMTGLPHSTIRFWEKSFPVLQPKRSSGGHRYYNMEQVELLQYLKRLLHEEGYTIDGAKKRLASEKIGDKKEEIPQKTKSLEEEPSEHLLQEMKSGLTDILSLLKKKL